MEQKIIDEEKINNILEKTKKAESLIICEIFKKAKEKKGLTLEEVGYLINLRDLDLEQELFNISGWIKEQIYGDRIVFFAPLYVSNFCVNDCEYCNFHIRNKNLYRTKLTFEQIEDQVKYLIDCGHKRLLLEFGEDPINNPIDYVVDVIEKIYSIKTRKGNIRRINVNIAATTVENYRKLKQAKIGTYQLFQETYHRETYEILHRGPKADYNRQITAYERALEAGIDDFGLGVLFGLYDWRFEVLSLISHSQYLDKKYGIGPHTISVPRFRPAQTVTYQSKYPVSDNDFLKIIAIIRLSLPYTGIIISTREKPEIRKIAFKIGVSQSSAGSVTTVGGYGQKENQGQFEISDNRSLHNVIKSILEDNMLPSFCTACYRNGRTGETFMSLSKDAEIHNFCLPNSLLTFAEYLEDFAYFEKDGIYDKGYKIINLYLNKIKSESVSLYNQTKERLNKIKQGQRDLYF